MQNNSEWERKLANQETSEKSDLEENCNSIFATDCDWLDLLQNDTKPIKGNPVAFYLNNLKIPEGKNTFKFPNTNKPPYSPPEVRDFFL
jgi:hypothetical protein